MSCGSPMNPSCFEDHGWKYLEEYRGLVLHDRQGNIVVDRDMAPAKTSRHLDSIRGADDSPTP